MLLRLARTARRVPSLYQVSRHESGWSKSEHRQASYIGALAIAAGTVAAVKMATSDDMEHERSDYVRVLKRTLTPSEPCLCSL